MTTPSCCVVIPTTGSSFLRQAVESTGTDCDVMLMTDSRDGYLRTFSLWKDCRWGSRVRIAQLPYQVGGGPWRGHRLYAASPHLVVHDRMLFLDEDNWYEPEHVRTMSDALDVSSVAYSYRSIHDRLTGEFICHDACESLGPFERGIGGRRLVDTSCWGFRTEWLIQHGHYWHRPDDADAQFTEFVARLNRATMTSNYRYSVCYRLSANSGAPDADFFLRGNARYASKAEASAQ